MDKRENVYNVKAVVAATGLSADTLRAWERRYGAVEPQRAETGRRLYSRADVGRLRLLAEAVERGHSIGAIAALEDAALEALIQEPESAGRRAPLGLDASVSAVLDAIEAYDADRCERTIAMALAATPVEAAIDDLLLPLLVETGERWHRGEFTIAQERLISSTIRRLALNLLTMLSARTGATRLLVGTLPGEQHELGALLLAVNAAVLGVACDYVGAELPGAEFARIAKERGVAAVGLSAVLDPAPEPVAAELKKLASALPTSIEIWLGGAGAATLLKGAIKKRVVLISSLPAVRHRIRLLG